MRLKFFKPAAIIITGFLLIISCNKEEETIDQTTGQAMEQTISLSAFETYLNTDLSEGMIHGDNVITIVDGESQTINQFTDDDKFREWSYSNGSLKSSPNKNIYELNSFLNAVGKLAEEKGYVKTYEYGNELPADITALLEASGFSSSLKSVSGAMSILYDSDNYLDQLCGVPTSFCPALGDVHKNKTNSLQQLGITTGVYCDGTWFRGEKEFVVSFPYALIPYLGAFSNKIESIFSTN